jgi:hypothetical protein
VHQSRNGPAQTGEPPSRFLYSKFVYHQCNWPGAIALLQILSRYSVVVAGSSWSLFNAPST